MDAEVGDEVRLLATGTQWLKVIMKQGGGFLLARSDGQPYRLVDRSAIIERKQADAVTGPAARRRSGIARLYGAPVYAYLAAEHSQTHTVTISVICNPGGGHYVRNFTIAAGDFQAISA